MLSQPIHWPVEAGPGPERVLELTLCRWYSCEEIALHLGTEGHDK